MTDRTNTFSLPFLFETGLCAMAIGSFATIVIHGLQSEWTIENVLGCLVLGGIFSFAFSPICFGVIPLDENFSNTLNAWPGILVSFGIFLAIASKQTPLPGTPVAIRRLGPLCRGLLWIYRYARYVWLIFPLLGTAFGIFCILYLRRPDFQTAQGSGDGLMTGSNADNTEPGGGD